MNDLLTAFLADQRIRRMAPKSMAKDEIRMRTFLTWAEARQLNPCLARREDVLSYLVHLQDAGHKAATLQREFSTLGIFYEFLEERGDSSSASHVRSIRKKYLRDCKPDAEERQIISVEQAAQMVAATIDTRDRSILLLLLKTGIRLGESEKLDLSDVDMTGMSIRLKPTAKRTNRTVFFDCEAQEALLRWLAIRERRANGDPALFLATNRGRLLENGLRKLILRAASRVGPHTPGAPLERRFGHHCCRHWFTTFAAPVCPASSYRSYGAMSGKKRSISMTTSIRMN
jgi:integrase/recombinase XerD